MSLVRRLTWAVGLLVLLGVAGASGGCGEETGPDAVVVLKNPPPLPDDTWCVVSNELAKPGYAVTYHGQTYFLCCKKCIRAFKADPERYARSGPGIDAPPPGASAAHDH